jgi:hypothetical protein
MAGMDGHGRAELVKELERPYMIRVMCVIKYFDILNN